MKDMKTNTKTMESSLPESLIDSAKVQAEEGRCGDVSDYVRSLIRKDVRQREEDKLERMLLEGVRSGRGIEIGSKEWETFWEDIYASIRAEKHLYAWGGPSAHPGSRDGLGTGRRASQDVQGRAHPGSLKNALATAVATSNGGPQDAFCQCTRRWSTPRRGWNLKSLPWSKGRRAWAAGALAIPVRST
jgi:antitoxin ParD1/3/4